MLLEKEIAESFHSGGWIYAAHVMFATQALRCGAGELEIETTNDLGRFVA